MSLLSRGSTASAAPIAPDSPRTGFHVSDLSTWEDWIWYLSTPTPGRSERVNWHFKLTDGTYSTDASHSMLLEAFKEAFWGMLQDGRWYGKTLHVGSSGPFGVGMRELFIWMVWRGHKSFAALDSVEQGHYLSDLPKLIVDRQGFYASSDSRPTSEFDCEVDQAVDDDDVQVPEAVNDPGDQDEGAGDDDDEERFTFHQAYIRLNVIYYVFAQSPVLEEAGLDAMPEEPFFGNKVGAQVNTVAKHVAAITPPLPDEVAIALLKSVLTWLDSRGEEVLSLQAKYFLLKNELVDRGYKEATIKNHLSKLLAEHSFSVEPSGTNAWHAPLGRLATNDLRHLLLRLRDACVLALEYFVGMRISEICSIEFGPCSEEEFPACIEVRYSKSGLMQLFFVNGLLSKGKKVPVAEQWLIGCRPVGSAELPPAVRALMLLDRLFAPWRQERHFDALIGAFTNPHSLPWRSNVRSASSASLLKGKRRFLAQWVDFSSLPDYNSRGEHTGMYRDSKGACIRSHHGRKTFAAYVLETRTSLLVAVSRHFKHLNTAITESSYFAPITRLRQETEAARASSTVAFFVEVLQGRKVYGRMAELVYKFFGTSEWREIKSEVEAFRKVEELVTIHGLQLYFSSHGICMIRANPLESRCQEADTGASWLNDVPQYAARSPGLCSGCGCNLMDASHLPFWRSRATAHFDEASSFEAEFRVHLFRRDQATKIVQLLEGNV